MRRFVVAILLGMMVLGGASAVYAADGNAQDEELTEADMEAMFAEDDKKLEAGLDKTRREIKELIRKIAEENKKQAEENKKQAEENKKQAEENKKQAELTEINRLLKKINFLFDEMKSKFDGDDICSSADRINEIHRELDEIIHVAPKVSQENYKKGRAIVMTLIDGCK
jgi:TolA-binding protein